MGDRLQAVPNRAHKCLVMSKQGASGNGGVPGKASEGAQ